MTTYSDEEKVKIRKTTKTVSILIAVFAVLFFLIMSKKIYSYKTEHPGEYSWKFALLNPYEKAVATGMEKTGEFEAKLSPAPKKGGYSIFDDISNSHKK